jgi:hypothetical protein
MKIIWEIVKVVLPAFIAWVLANRSSKKSTESNRSEMREQLNIAKKNSLEVQNRSFKLQFCIRELEKDELIYEKSLSDINVVAQSIERYLQNYGNVKDIQMSAQQANGQLHEVMYRTGTLQTIIRAANANAEKTFIKNLEALKNTGTKIEAQMDLLSSSDLKPTQVKKNYNSEDIRNFLNDLITMRNFILEQMHIVFKQMGYVEKKYEK